jgi:hypothetical protein
LIKKILSESRSNENSGAFSASPTQQATDGEVMVVQKPKSQLKVSSFVVEMEIAPKRKPETYTQEI